MIADELATFMGVDRGIEISACQERTRSSEKSENMIAVEGELKKFKPELKLAEDESEQCKAPREENEHVVYVT